jgi:DNA-binding transcriptional LysR family regulator
MIVRYLEYIVALSSERHFARAAAACNVTQPTLSAGIKQLEEGLGVLIVERRQRFVGFTPEGERVLAWAQRVLADYSGLTQELSELREGLEGKIHIGAILVSLPTIALLTTPFAAIHSRTRYQVISQTSIEIQRGLDDFTIDVGISSSASPKPDSGSPRRRASPLMAAAGAPAADAPAASIAQILMQIDLVSR